MAPIASQRCARSTRRWRIVSLLISAAGLLASACGPQGATPIPQPPLGAFPLDSVDTPQADSNDPKQVLFSSRPSGAAKAEPAPGAVVRVTNLDSTAAASETNSDAAGNFTLSAQASLGDELRFESLLDGRHSGPSDAVLAQSNAELGLVPSPRFACLLLVPGYFVGFGGSTHASVRVHNGCAEPVSLSNPRLRRGLADFALTSTLPLDLPSGQDRSLDLVFTPNASGLREDTLFFDVTLSTELIRYPVTLSSDPPL